MLYLRQSVARDDSISIELQEIAGRDYCAQHGYDVVAVEIDEGISGRTWTKRPAVQRVIDMIESREADVIVLWKWSRLSRSRKDWAVAADRVDVAGGRIESATEPIDTATASGRFARGVMTEYAAFQSEQIGEQWAEVRARRFSLGLPPAGKVPWGWVSRKTHIESIPEQVPIVRTMYRLYGEGRGAAYIAYWLNAQGIPAPRGGDWRPVTVTSCLDSPIHAGLVSYLGETRKGAHEGIISEAEYAKYRRMRDDRSTPKKPRRSTYLLSTLVVCHCGLKRAGSTLTERRQSGRTVSYYSYKCPAATEHTKSVAAWRVEIPVVEWLRSFKVSPAPAPPVSAQADADAIAREILDAERTMDRLTLQLAQDIIPKASYERTRDSLLTEINRLQAAQREAALQTMLPPSAYLDAHADALDSWDDLQVADKQAVLRGVVRSITIRDDGLIEVLPQWGGEPIVLEQAQGVNAG
ncbi:recombinase family protein [Leucobacter massiliensis]|uniref:recombinase family protein n=1 Tax=Leucobacter massiliensis TaxID=1686285 RepID=UPI0015E37927|nr:recombinase family protein [Leucobacter massiliensis]